MRKIALMTVFLVLTACGQSDNKAKTISAGSPGSTTSTADPTTSTRGETATSGPGSSSTAGSSAGSSTHSSTVSPSRTTSPPASPRPTDLGTPAQASDGSVSVTPTAASYPARESVTATVTNGSAATIYTEDMKTGCSILFLDRQSGSAWTPITGCGMERPPAVVAIGSGRARTVSISPQDAQPGEPAGAGFAPGTYRLRLTYSTNSNPSGDEPLTATSTTFTISA